MLGHTNNAQKTRVLNLYGAPGAGKSTGAAYIFSKLKLKEISCELVTEYAKDVVYEGSLNLLKNPIWMLANQYERMRRLQGKVDLIISDSPLQLASFYARRFGVDMPVLEVLIQTLEHEFDNLNVLVRRTRRYSQTGRLETERESNAIHRELENILHPVMNIGGDEEGYDSLIRQIEGELKQ